MSKISKFQWIGAILCTASVLLTPFNLAAVYQDQCCQPDYQVCCQQDPCCVQDECDPCAKGAGGGLKKNAWWLLGAAALGAAAGAGAGYAASSGSHRGRTGPAGPAGPAGTFPTAIGSIDFTILIVLSLEILGGPIQPFVEAPNGQIFFGLPFGNALIDLGILQSRTITVPSPAIIGTYHVGVNVPPSILAATLLVSGIAAPSRGGTSVLNFPPAAIAIGIAAPSFQVTAEFTYGPDVAPIIP